MRFGSNPCYSPNRGTGVQPRGRPWRPTSSNRRGLTIPPSSGRFALPHHAMHVRRHMPHSAQRYSDGIAHGIMEVGRSPPVLAILGSWRGVGVRVRAVQGWGWCEGTECKAGVCLSPGCRTVGRCRTLSDGCRTLSDHCRTVGLSDCRTYVGGLSDTVGLMSDGL